MLQLCLIVSKYKVMYLLQSMAVRPGGRSNCGGRRRLSLVCSAVMSMLFIITLLVPNLLIEAAGINPLSAFTATREDEVNVATREDEVNVVGSGRSRKLLQMTRICSKNDVVIYQGSTEPLPSGIPAFSVEILNVCVSGCYITNIHVSCGWFSSVHLINPQVFRRVDFDDCVVNNGEVLGPGQSLSFQYANSFQYPLTVSSVDCS